MQNICIYFSLSDMNTSVVTDPKNNPFPSSFLQANSLQELEWIHRKGINLIYWSRARHPQIKNYLAHSPSLKGFQVTISEGNTNHLENELACLPGKSITPGRHELIFDILFLVRLFLSIQPKQSLRVNFERVQTDACRLFHSDFVDLRLLCTYDGPATQWIENTCVDRSGLGSGCNDRIVTDFSRIHELPLQSVAILKGDRYPGEEGNGVIHRSPPLDGSGMHRYLLRIDTQESST